MKLGDTKNHFGRGDRVMIREGYYECGRKATCLGPSLFAVQWWTPIVYDGEEDPTFHKPDGLVLISPRD